MRFFPSDWQAFLDQLVVWGELSIPARRTFLDGFRPGLSLEATPGNPGMKELKDSGFLAESPRAGYLGVAPEHEGFHHVMKALEKCPVLESPSLAVLSAYLADHYSSRERSLLHESLALLPNDMPRVAGLVSSVQWLDAALPQHGTPSSAAGLEAARGMLTFFREQRDHVAIRDLEEYFPGMDREKLCGGIRIGIQRAVFFLGLRRKDLEPLVGIWPAAARRLRRMQVVLAPEPVNAARTFHHPYLVEDMTTLLLAARVEPIPLRRGDEKPFIRFVQDISPMLLSIPQWMDTFPELSEESRITLALQALRATGLVVPDGPQATTAAQRQIRRSRRTPGVTATSRRRSRPGGTAWREPALVPAPWSNAWMAQDLGERREQIIGMLAIGVGGASGLFDLLDEEWTSPDTRDEIVPWLVQAFSSVPTTSFLRFADFAEYQAAMGSPLRAVEHSATLQGSADPGSTSGTVGHGAESEEALEEQWKSFLGTFIARCLLSLDGVEAGITDDGAACFRLTHTGKRILGLPGDGKGSRGSSEASPAAIVVQPNFEIVFLVPSPAAEAILARFCERLGKEVGTLFRITKQSALRGAEWGLGIDQIIGPLERYSRSELPPNVRQEIEGWLSVSDLDSASPAP